jgi:hypothetical protein
MKTSFNLPRSCGDRRDELALRAKLLAKAATRLNRYQHSLSAQALNLLKSPDCAVPQSAAFKLETILRSGDFCFMFLKCLFDDFGGHIQSWRL